MIKADLDLDCDCIDFIDLGSAMAFSNTRKPNWVLILGLILCLGLIGSGLYLAFKTEKQEVVPCKQESSNGIY